MNELIELKGILKKVIYRNEDSFFSVFLFEVDDEEIIVTGYTTNFEIDSSYILKGNYVEHYKYGFQFSVTSFNKELPNSKEAVINYLSGPLFTGIGKKIAEKIVEKIGENALIDIKKNPSLLDGIEKLNASKKEVILNVLNNINDDLEEITNFFIKHNVSLRNVKTIYRLYGNKAIEIIKENPYRLVYECYGIGFKTADKIGQSLGFDYYDEKRLISFMYDYCGYIIMSNGDTYIELEEFRNSILSIIKNIDFDLILNKCLQYKILVLDNNFLYTKIQYDAEIYIASFLSNFPYFQLENYDKDLLDYYFKEIQNILNINYDEMQINAIKCFFDNDFSILTGGPGTGKTTVVRGIVYMFKKLFPNLTLACCAPTGRAAKRLSELTETNTYTIHSLLKWDLHTNIFAINETNPLEIDLLIIDEFSMVDNYLFYNLLKASSNVKKILIIGDEDQLPSVGPGCLLKDIIESNIFQTTRLKHIFRQQEGSGIIQLSTMVNKSNVDFSKISSDVKFINTNDVVNTTIKIIESAINKGYSLNDIQVLSSMYKGASGIDYLNYNIQKYFNNNYIKEFKIGKKSYRLNDKILQLKNQTDDDIYNGDIGILCDIKDDYVYVDYDNNIVEYSKQNITNITHAYCISIHKSQGLEYPIVIIPIVKEQLIMLNKKLLYTAITRGKKSVILIGDIDIFNLSIQKNENHIRKTRLKENIKKVINFE